MSTDKLDKAFAAIASKLINMTIKTTGSSSKEVLNISQNYLNSKTHKTLENFYHLYFSNETQQQKDLMNQEVDDLVDQAIAQRDSGEQISIEASKEADERRLGLSAVQKELEGLITLDKGMKDNLMPILSSLQFEDATRQRLEHIEKGLQQIIDAGCDETKVNFNALKDLTSSLEETAQFCKEVLNEDPPANAANNQKSLLFF